VPAGDPVDPRPATRPARAVLAGRYVRVEPLDPDRHGNALWAGLGGRANEPLWRYMHAGPFPDRAAFDAWLRERARTDDPLCHAIVDLPSERAAGIASYMRIDEDNRVIEVGSIVYSGVLQRSRGATEAMYLMARHVFEDLGYRRYEWKCNTLNEPSRRAALRLGFTFEGIFRQHMIVKERSRDTAWYAMLDGEWPARREAFERWLDPANFDAEGRQRTALGDGRA
jgi:RimJ/RimL family protein N-acetyltransferase